MDMGDNLMQIPSNLRIFRVLDPEVNPLIHDFTILGFRKMSPTYERGRKTSSLYMCVNTDEIIIEKVFTDVRDELGNLTGLQVTFNWYDEENQITLTKTEIVKSFNKYEAQTEERKRRERQLDYMIASGKDTPIEPHIDTIFKHYSYQEQQYRTHGALDLAVDMKAETDPTILGILNIQTIPPGVHPYWPSGCTVMQGIIYQVTGEKYYA